MSTTKKKGKSAGGLGALTGRSAALARLAAGTNPNDKTAADKVRRMLNIVKDPQSEAQGVRCFRNSVAQLRGEREA
ncbi:hypothetical protein [Bradyrhizobium ivorense]|uniref:hypothetical protein n=1 Tax=Bradyrhizobium ivorense TaxID=2511166 RepID=UPI001FCF1386|nr:hypothetical protein [Bradyrhizobium ivorense]